MNSLKLIQLVEDVLEKKLKKLDEKSAIGEEEVQLVINMANTIMQLAFAKQSLESK